jgi:uncharacterized membrane protein
MPDKGEFFYPCLICSCLIILSFIFFTTYRNNKDFFNNNKQIKNGLWTGYFFGGIILLFVSFMHIITTCTTDGSKYSGIEYILGLTTTVSCLITVLILALTYYFNKNTFNSNKQAIEDFWLNFGLFSIIMLIIIIKYFIYPKCNGKTCEYNLKAFLPDFNPK